MMTTTNVVIFQDNDNDEDRLQTSFMDGQTSLTKRNLELPKKMKIPDDGQGGGLVDRPGEKQAFIARAKPHWVASSPDKSPDRQ